ncbi:DUF58 domain-containing protein [Pseudobacteriovorax antillogorgiicola]|uniref:DUF58 domain-containing protein n=1 Tax=Pseudobacteriovorax antillogorgiicola TaxID=1513793 RepID=A0A1Y6BEU7_9BACT|nr:DUF58 domain-containing protein [Pseudobacteriovorax antillogorgiicola]TCS56276.1 hypothetical protein EDD56_10498 [Pseudobacteriovorax antillogorgiicola]SMF07714.1 hypothetical protein SAMN06296036_104235 [Pseudobacteriovorax antillogorgiicola]
MYFKGVNRGLNFTVLGRYLVAMTLGVGAIAVFTGVNGMFLFLGLSLGIFTVSGLISEKNIKHVVFHMKSAPQFFDEGKQGPLQFDVENTSRQHSLFAIDASFFLTKPKFSFWGKKTLAAAKKFVIQISPGVKESFETYFDPQARGYFDHLYIHQSTTFPFGIFLKYRFQKVCAKIFILPRVDESKLKQWERIARNLVHAQVGMDEFIGHQPYDRTIPFKLIDWKKNAGRDMGQWYAKKFSHEARQHKLCLTTPKEYGSALHGENFELLLRKLRTGLEVLHSRGFDLSLDLHELGRASGYQNAMIVLAMANPNRPAEKQNSPSGLRIKVTLDHIQVLHD